MPWLVLPHSSLHVSDEQAASTPLLDLIREAGGSLRQACRNGVCGICQCQRVSGDIDYRRATPHGLNARELSEGMILPCIAYMQSDVTLAASPYVSPAREVLSPRT